MVKIAISGGQGRMGQRIAALGFESPQIEVVGALEHEGHPDLGKRLDGPKGCDIKLSSDTDSVLSLADCLIEFSLPKATLEHLESAVYKKRAMVIGTTGFDSGEKGQIKRASEKIPIVFSPNMSVGVNLLFAMTRQAAGILREGFEVDILDIHHRHKKDAPSGTAKHLGEIISEVQSGKRPAIESRREGEVVGDHTVSFKGVQEEIQLIHRAKSRDTFAKGALLAALFVSQKRKGLYSMHNVLGFQS
jgi:4-hydroxy-tetrahydrodipicolinate reductase